MIVPFFLSNLSMGADASTAVAAPVVMSTFLLIGIVLPLVLL